MSTDKLYNENDTSNSTLGIVSTSCYSEIPFPLSRTIQYTGQKLLTFNLNVKKITEQMNNYCYNKNVRNNWC